MLGVLLLLAAHQFTHPKVLRIGVKPDQLLIAANYDVNPGQDALQLRSLFDRDADGKLSPEEQDKLTTYLEQMAMLYFELEVDGAKVKPAKISATPFRIDLPASATDALGIALLYSVPIPSHETVELVFVDQSKSREAHVPVVVDLTEGWEVAFASQGELSPSPFSIQRVRLDRGRPLVLRLRRTKTRATRPDGSPV